MNYKQNFQRSLKIVSVIILGIIILFVIFGILASKNTSVGREAKSETANTLDIPSSTASRRYPEANYVTETFTGDGVTKIFKLKRSYDDVEARINGRMATMAPWGNCATVDICYDIKGARLIFQEIPVKGSVITFTGAGL